MKTPTPTPKTMGRPKLPPELVRVRLACTVAPETLACLEGMVSESDPRDNIGRVLDALARAALPVTPPFGEFDKWLSSPDARQYAGQHAAWLPGAGVVGIAPAADELLEKLAGNPKVDEMSFAIVPASYQRG